MALAAVQKEIRSVVNSCHPSIKLEVIQWMREFADEEIKEASHSNNDAILNQIREDLQEVLPLSATLPSENLIYHQGGKNEDCDPTTTVHVDGFLYDEEALEELEADSKLNRNFCKKCGSHQIAPLTFISHSTSMTQLKYLFHFLLPDLTGRTLVDVGSRLGAVLYGAYYYSNASNIVGIEINQDMCRLQEKVRDKYGLQDRVQVICDDVKNQLEILKSADSVVMNNVFEFFVPLEIQRSIWTSLYESLRKPGTLLVLSPSLEESLKPLKIPINLSSWVAPVDTSAQLTAANRLLFDSSTSEDSDLTDIHVYRVL